MALRKALRTQGQNILLCVGLWVIVSSCATTDSLHTAENTNAPRSYWKVFEKTDGRFYLIPRPELTPEFPTIASINSLSRAEAHTWAAKLNAQIQFRVEKTIEGNSLMMRVVPEPLMDDVVDMCRGKKVHPILESRCKKELAWASRGTRPDIYLQYDGCEAVAMMRALNDLYGRQSPTNDLCPQLDQVAK